MFGLSLDDRRWKDLTSAYGVAYDASVPLQALAGGAEPAVIWSELWRHLHHQGSVGEASYVAVPTLVSVCRQRRLHDWNLFALCAAIEVCRRKPGNPGLPTWLERAYAAAWAELFALGLEVLPSAADESTVRSVLAVCALQKGLWQLGGLLIELDASEIAELQAESRGPQRHGS